MKPLELNNEDANETLQILEKFELQFSKFEEDTRSENIIQIILRGHLYIEHELKQILEKSLAHPEMLGDRLKFSDFTRLVFAIGALDLEYYSVINELNKFRNKFAHDLNFVFTEEHLNKLEECLSNDLRDYYLRSKEQYNTTIDKTRNLIFWVWQTIIAENIIPKHIKEKLNV
ncbi:hypothetical protein EJP77_18690 [Paenibacillus zeisoli]|uniref:DUF86 domain-containing protein n=1 Tax=Paenibacillus zeisoli TaxID=2496267 RepID=A0A3S1D6P8_9BACL|nr:hypothetical protein [Paenibacillus zeisoli]RUT27657.1 hypothetical protein EJP77_20505 [Paenibacillus zeisoli]RUT28044.1 hypothetical protein EJP77_18690 [Paenibacillus zeisoli]